MTKIPQPLLRLRQTWRKALLAAVCLLSVCCAARAQSTPQEINADLRHMFSQVHYQFPGQNYLYDMAVHETDSNLFVPYNTHDTLTTDLFFKMYEEMRNCATDTTLLDPADTVYVHSMNNYPDTVSMMMMYNNYFKLLPDALTTNNYFNFDTVNNLLYDRYPNVYYPYNYLQVFAAAPNRMNMPFREVVFKIDPANSLGSTPNTGYLIDMDFGDGTGWHYFPQNTVSYYRVTYPSAGSFIIRTGLSDMYAPPAVLSQSLINILSNKSLTPPDETLDLPGINANVYYPCDKSGQPYEKVIFYLEGIDVLDCFPAANTDAGYIYDNVIAGTGLANLRNFGYTFVVVDWKNSREAIQLNALAFGKLLDQMKCRQSDLTKGEDFVVLGESMGGLVARYALTYMETHPGGCQPQKLHNTRLLMTFDSPHRGANIPMSLQHAYRVIAGNFIGGNTVTQQAIGMAHNLFLDAMAARQMLLYHVNTYNPLLFNSPYGPDPARIAFEADLASIGNYPKYCKMVATSDGSLAGNDQTRQWDGALRVPNDALLSYNHDRKVRIFGREFKIAGTKMDLRTAPNGTGRIATFENGTWFVRVKLRLFGIRFITGFNSLLGKYYDADMQPIDTKPGGIFGMSNVPGKLGATIQDMLPGWGEATVTPMNNGHMDIHHSSGGWIGGAHDIDIYSDGFHWNFIPSWSALDYDNNGSLNPDIEHEPMISKMSKTPFDVIMGIPEQFSGPSAMYKYNSEHVDIRNDALLFKKDEQIYKLCDNKVKIRLLNREIGDDKLYLENRTLPWRNQVGAEDELYVNHRNPNYEYASSALPDPDVLPGVYSRENAFIIDPSTGESDMYANNSAVYYDPPYSGPYSIRDLGWKHCCEDYEHKSSVRHAAAIVPPAGNELTVFPNPVSGDQLIARFTPQADVQSRIVVTDLLGRTVLERTFAVSAQKGMYHYPVTLPKNLTPGVYLISVKNGKQTLHTKMTRQ